MKKKILMLFAIVTSLSVLPVYADKEYKFTINNTLENKEIVYTWENTIDNFNFEMVSPSKNRYSLASYDQIEYSGDKNQVSIRFSELEPGTWKVFFRGDSDPRGLKNKIQDYVPEVETKEFVEPTTSEEEKSSTGVIIIGGSTEETKEEIKEEVKEEPKEEVKEEVKEETKEQTESEEEVKEDDVSEEENVEASDEEILKRKESLKAERDSARKVQKETFDEINKLKSEASKKEEEVVEVPSEDKEAEDETKEVLLNFEDTQDVPETKEDDSQQVIFMGGEQPTEITVDSDSLVTGTDELTIVNINADEERAKEVARIEKIAANRQRDNILMVLPLIISGILVFLDIIFEINRKKTRGMVDFNLKNFDSYVDRSEESSYRQDGGEDNYEFVENNNKKGFGLFNKSNEEEVIEDTNSLETESPIDFSKEPNLKKKKKAAIFGFNSEDIKEEVVQEESIKEDVSSNNFSEIDENEDDYTQFRPPVFDKSIYEEPEEERIESTDFFMNENKEPETSDVTRPVSNQGMSFSNKVDTVQTISEEEDVPKKKSKYSKNLFGNDSDDFSFKKPNFKEEDFNWDE